jgi:transcription elongation factor Elf1
MKSTEFVTRWERLSDFTCVTNCPRCGEEVITSVSMVLRRREAQCKACNNSGVATATSVVWKYAYEGRESLADEVARTKPRNPPRKRDEPLSFDTSDDLAELFRRRDEQKKID